VTRISSRSYLDGARGQPCTLRIAGVCTGGGDDTVPAHVRDRHTGRSIKASDCSVADACAACHAKFDGQSGEPLSKEDWLIYALRGIQETLENRIGRGIVTLALDKRRTEKPRPKTKGRGFPQGHRPLKSRNTFKENAR
jgi:hypothetical protein